MTSGFAVTRAGCHETVRREIRTDKLPVTRVFRKWCYQPFDCKTAGECLVKSPLVWESYGKIKL